MSRSRSRLAADWFARLRTNLITDEVEHLDLEAEKEATALAAQAVIDAKPKEDN